MFCPKCNEYPDTLVYGYDGYKERVTWNVDEYEVMETDIGDLVSIKCSVCTELVVEKEDNEDNN